MKEDRCCVDVLVGRENKGVAERDLQAENVYADIGEEYDDIDMLVEQGFEAFMKENRTKDTGHVEENGENPKLPIPGRPNLELLEPTKKTGSTPKHMHNRVENIAKQLLHLRKQLVEANNKVEELVKGIEEKDIEDKCLKDAEMNKVGEWLIEDTLKEREKEITELKTEIVKQAELMRSMEDEKKQIMLRFNAFESEKDELVKEVNVKEENIGKWKAMMDELKAEKENTFLEAVSSATQTATGLRLQQELREHADAAKNVARKDEDPNSMYKHKKSRARAINEDTQYDYCIRKKTQKDGSTSNE